MGSRGWKSFLVVLACSLVCTGIGWADTIINPDLYSELGGGWEEYTVKKGDRLPAIAQRRAMRWRVLAKQNNLKNPDTLKPGTVLRLNNTFILPNDLTDGLVVNLPELAVYHFENGVLRRRYALAAGRTDWQTPTGNYKILNKAKNPTWRVPISIQDYMWAKGLPVVTEVPPGPKNPLGAYWMATSAPGVGFHATIKPWSIGHFASHGCLRMLPDEIEELFPLIEVGTPVKIMYKPIKLAVTSDNRVFLEVHRDVYKKAPNLLKDVETLIKNKQLADRVDWRRVHQVVKERDGVAEDVTLYPPRAEVLSPISNRLYSGEIVTKPVDPPLPPEVQPDIKKKPVAPSGS
ncbi:MAG: LysM peptidoglycan-binding domain-containing protein [Deltaproteobacteria bacterium]|nr:LysM peptidoglycan-binding domain-containing protein [Deltaproteobacteria bacterium]